MTSQEFGELIRAHREAKGLSIEELASRFKLSVSTVRGIEEGSLDHMPHAVYAKGFVRAYAQAVGVAPEELQAGLVVLFPEEMFADVPTVPSPVSGKASGQRRRGHSSPILFSLLVLVLVGVAGWYVVAHFDSLKSVVSQYFSAASPESASPHVSVPVPAGQTPDAASVASAQAAPAPEPSAVTPSQAQEQPGENAAPPLFAAAQEGTTEAQTAAPAMVPGVAVPPPAEPLPSGTNQLVIDAIEECWIQVSTDGGLARTYTVYPGETSTLPYKTKMLLVLGNAGGVMLTHNGKPYVHNSRRNEKKTLTFQ